MAQRSRQLLADMYSRLVTDQTALKSLISSTKPLRAFAHELASLTSKPEAVLGEDVKTTDEWLDQVEGMNGSLETLNEKLEPITFLSGNAPTAADYSLLHLSMTSFLHFHRQLSTPTLRSCATFHTCRTFLPDQTSIRL